MKRTALLLIFLMLLTSGCAPNHSQPTEASTPDQTTLPTESTTIPTTVSTQPTESTTQPTESTTQPTESTTQPTESTTQPTEEVTAPQIPAGGAICDTCGQVYAYGEGFEGLCFICQELYGPKCVVCGSDCTYSGTMDGKCYECYTASADLQPCITCGELWYFWEMFEGECFVCNPYGGMDPAECGYCSSCGAIEHLSTLYENMCHNCALDCGLIFYCPGCGTLCDRYTESGGLCLNCACPGEAICSSCGENILSDTTGDGLCDLCRYWSTPNVFCPECGYSWMESGVGIEGFFCPECGCNFYP